MSNLVPLTPLFPVHNVALPATIFYQTILNRTAHYSGPNRARVLLNVGRSLKLTRGYRPLVPRSQESTLAWLQFYVTVFLYTRFNVPALRYSRLNSRRAKRYRPTGPSTFQTTFSTIGSRHTLADLARRQFPSRRCTGTRATPLGRPTERSTAGRCRCPDTTCSCSCC